MILLLILIKKNHLQVYFEECKYRIKTLKLPKFIKNELKSDSDDKLMAKLIDYDSDSKVESKSNAKKYFILNKF